MTAATVEAVAIVAAVSLPYGPPSGKPIPYAGASAGIARDVVRDALRGWSAEQVDDAALLVTELMSNAVIHGRPGLELAVDSTRDGVRVSVTDAGIEMPRRRPAWEGSHRGLEIVEMLSSDWGYDVLPAGGKTVWFELRQ